MKNKNHLKIPFLLLMVLCTLSVFSQTKTITGKVTDEKGTAVPGASILEKKSQSGTAADADGNFHITVPDNTTAVEVSAIGFITQNVVISGTEPLTIVLKEEQKSDLNEVVVVGYGTARRKDVTGAVSSLSSKEFNKGTISNPMQQVAGKVPGLVITQPSGDPNQTVNIRLRGQTSLTGNQSPLIVVDGVQLPDPNMISTISPADIVSYDVLKDASATAIYGSRGANGVILISTKKGSAGRTQVDYSGSIGFDKNAKKYDLLNAQDFLAAGGTTNNQAAPPYNFTLTNGNTDWIDAITRTGFSTNHSLGISGGTGGFNYHGSFSYLNQKGIVINTGKEMYGLNFNAQQKALNNKLTINLGINSNRVNRKYADPTIFYYVLQMPPVAPLYDSSGGYYGFFNGFLM